MTACRYGEEEAAPGLQQLLHQGGGMWLMAQGVLSKARHRTSSKYRGTKGLSSMQPAETRGARQQNKGGRAAGQFRGQSTCGTHDLIT